MRKTAALGISDFETIVKEDVFYVDKTHFIKEWWENKDRVTLITRPHRFGKTLTLSMVNTFFSNRFENRKDIFENFSIWKEEKFCAMQGSYPVIFLSLADVKQESYQSMTEKMKRLIGDMYKRHNYLLKSEELLEDEKEVFKRLASWKGTDDEYKEALLRLSGYLYKHFGKKAIILIDEYDTPMLEAYVEGYWEEAIVYIRRMFHATFKDNPYLERGLMTGITRITQESIFSDLNNLRVVTTTSDVYTTCFGFTEKEVFAALNDFELSDKREEVKLWYDGFQFGKQKDIYNPWSIINFLSEGRLEPYWMNTSGNALVGKLVQNGMIDVKQEFEALLRGESIVTEIDEAITYAELEGDSKAVWSWFLTTGYLKIVSREEHGFEVALTNYEVRVAFYKLVKKWFDKAYNYYRNFMSMLLKGDVEGMQYYMERVIMRTFSYFDVGNGTTESEKSEQFYHGFTLGLIADLNYSHVVTSNRESGFGRYDVCIEPLDKNQAGIIIEFKVFDAKKEDSLEDTAKRALMQIEEKNYESALKARGIKNVRRYAFVFQGKNVLIVE